MARALIIDNYDSFTHNLAQLLHGLVDEVQVARNDEIDLDGVRALAPDHILLSPGPGRPEVERDFGVCAPILQAAKEGLLAQPILGVCLGHQGIAHAFGARVVRAPTVMHGKSSLVLHHGRDLFEGLDNPFEAMRYHSLVVDPTSLPDCLEAVAHTSDGVLMALRHRSLPIFGVQFHPESIGTPLGRRLVARFLGVEEVTP